MINIIPSAKATSAVGIGAKLFPLFSIDTVLDKDYGVISYVFKEFRNPKVFDLSKWEYQTSKIVGDLYHRKYSNPLYYLAKDEAYYPFLDECYAELLADHEAEILANSVTTDVLRLARIFKESGEIFPTILYKTPLERKLLEANTIFDNLNGVSYNLLEGDYERTNCFTQFYLKYFPEVDLFPDLRGKTIYISTAARNLNENNDDFHEDYNERLIALGKRGNIINLFDVYRNDVIGRYSDE